jgi:tRNA G37 N-methylase Trm5
MELAVGAAWGDGYKAPKLLGCYEADLHTHLRKAVKRAPGTVVIVGCAEGYYAVGMARLLPEATVFAFDINSKAAAVCRRAAELNGVNKRLLVDGLCTISMLGDLVARGGRPLIFMDIEGGERELLDPVRVPLLGSCDIIVECHDFVDRSITATLQERFATSHEVELVTESTRFDPKRFMQLHSWFELDRLLVVHEGRPEIAKWLVCWAD